MSITIHPVTESLYHKYIHQNEPQGVYLEISQTDASLDWNGEIGNAVPEAVYHCRVRRYELPIIPKTDAANNLLTEWTPLIQRIADGLDSRWNGHNHIGTLTEDAQEANEELAELIDELRDCDHLAVVAWDAVDWLDDFNPAEYNLTAQTTDKELSAIVARLEDESKPDADIVYGLESFLNDKREELREEAEESNV